MSYNNTATNNNAQTMNNNVNNNAPTIETTLSPLTLTDLSLMLPKMTAAINSGNYAPVIHEFLNDKLPIGTLRAMYAKVNYQNFMEFITTYGMAPDLAYHLSQFFGEMDDATPSEAHLLVKDLGDNEAWCGILDIRHITAYLYANKTVDPSAPMPEDTTLLHTFIMSMKAGSSAFIRASTMARYPSVLNFLREYTDLQNQVQTKELLMEMIGDGQTYNGISFSRPNIEFTVELKAETTNKGDISMSNSTVKITAKALD